MSDSLSVLVVDDDFMVARIHAGFVARTPGFEVVGSARTGEEALRLDAELRPQVVLLDVHLPDLSGLEVLARLRGQGSAAAVVMVTAEREADVVRAALQGGAQQYLVKPFGWADLSARLEHVAAGLRSLAAGPTDQETIDRAFGAPREVAAPLALPKGLSPQSLELVRATLGEHAELSAAEAGERVGLSRVSARRYLEHLVASGSARVRLRYGSAGRPERRYRPV